MRHGPGGDRAVAAARTDRPNAAEKDDVRIGFGIMGGFNQAQAHAQFVANIVDFGLDVQEALEAGRFTKLTFGGCDVDVEALVPESVREELAALGHAITTFRPRTGAFGYGSFRARVADFR